MQPADPRLAAGRLGTVARGRAVRAVFGLPPSVVRRLAAPRDSRAPGLDPEARLLARLWGRPATPVPLAEARQRFDLTLGRMSARPTLEPRRRDHTIQAGAAHLPARLYTPAGAGPDGPLLVYFHGGGWTQGSIASHDGVCGLLAWMAGVRILSVGYRLAPEHRYPTALTDAYAAYAWAAAHATELGADPARIAVGGDSAGGTLATAIARLARDDEALPSASYQLLIYPVTDLTAETASRDAYATGFFLTKARIAAFTAQYVPDEARRTEPSASPLLADDLSGLPPAHVATAVADPLRDEGEAYAQRLLQAGVPVSLRRHDQLHGFVNTTVLRSSRDALAQIADALRAGTRP